MTINEYGMSETDFFTIGEGVAIWRKRECRYERLGVTKVWNNGRNFEAGGITFQWYKWRRWCVKGEQDNRSCSIRPEHWSSAHETVNEQRKADDEQRAQVNRLVGVNWLAVSPETRTLIESLLATPPLS